MADSHRISLPAKGVTDVPVAGSPVTGAESSQVNSPFDGSRLGDVPLLGQDDVDRAVAAAKSALHDQPLAPWQRAEILEKASALLRERQEEFAADHRARGRQADQDRSRRSRSSRRNVRVRRRRGAQARRRGDPDRCRTGWRHQGGVHDARADRRRRCDQSVQLPPQPGRAQGGAGYCRRVPRGSQTGWPDAIQRDRSCVAADRGVRASGVLPLGRHRTRLGRRQCAGRPSRRRPHHVHRLARGGLGHQVARTAQACRARARQQRAGHHRRGRRLEEGGRQDQDCWFLARRTVVHLDAADLGASRGG